ncbi:MAG: hypothetical protein C0594_10150 [Marinilabiliales bacterium]|nr:MAG: hypothetical protein C0594_10150 [Marinilabiliales bacterium]
MCKKCKNIEFGFTSEKFPAGTHMCLIYSNEEERAAVVSKFIDSGIKWKEKVAYFAHKMDKNEMDKWLESKGVFISETDVEVIKAKEIYYPDGEFIPGTMLDTLQQLYDSSKKEGYSAVRVCGEMVWALDNIPGSERLMEYEAKINQLMESHPVTALCQYDANKFDGATLLNCLKVHPYTIVNKQIVKNPYYLSPEEFLAEKK